MAETMERFNGVFEVGEIIEFDSPIDIHMHMRDPDASLKPGDDVKETIESATRAAEAGGYQATYDMPNNPNRPTVTVDRVEEKEDKIEREAHVDVGVIGGVDLLNPDYEQIDAMVPIVPMFKFYLGLTQGNEHELALPEARPVADFIIERARKYGVDPTIMLHAREEVGHEVAAYIANQEHPAHWCHVSTATEAMWSQELSRRYPEHFTAGVTPHHLTMTIRNAMIQQGWLGGRMMPPLAEEDDVNAVLKVFNASGIQVLETDHAPHTDQAKYNAEAMNPFGRDYDPETGERCTTCYGVSGVEFVLPIMMSLVQRGIITKERLQDALYTQPARVAGLDLSDNTAKTKVEVKPYRIAPEHVVGMSQNTPYIGWTAWGKVIGMERQARETARSLKRGMKL